MFSTIKCTLSILVLGFCLICGHPVQAQIDSDPDGLGVYFDTAATQVSATAEVGTEVQAYLIGTNLSVAGDIGYWQVHLCPSAGYGGISITGSPYGGFNYNMNMPGDGCWSCVTFLLDPALPTQEITLLASLNIQIWDDYPGGISLSSDEDYYQVVGSDEMIPFHPSTGDIDLPLAMINGPAPVATEVDTWDSIKATYR